uniref:Transposase n=1 Tax=Panagrellus redivivus TaxID=6233 RepID=A0A7E4VVW3_PANRE
MIRLGRVTLPPQPRPFRQTPVGLVRVAALGRSRQQLTTAFWLFCRLPGSSERIRPRRMATPGPAGHYARSVKMAGRSLLGVDLSI